MKTTIGKHKTTIERSPAGGLKVKYHETVVFWYHPLSREIVLDSGGWKTNTTKKRINQCFDDLGLPFRLIQEKFSWYIIRTDSDTARHRENWLDFHDHIKFNADLGEDLKELDAPGETPEGVVEVGVNKPEEKFFVLSGHALKVFALDSATGGKWRVIYRNTKTGRVKVKTHPDKSAALAHFDKMRAELESEAQL